MASIQKRHGKFRVRLRPQGLPILTLTFNTHKEAQEWVEDNEDKYIEDSEKYQEWIKLNRKSVKGNALFHVHIPLNDF